MNKTTNSYKLFLSTTKPFHSLYKLFTLMCLISVGVLIQLPTVHAQSKIHDELTMNGIAAHWALGREYYIATLFLPDISNDPETIFSMVGPKRMEIKVTNEKWSPRRFGQMWNQAILINNTQGDLNNMSGAIIAFTALAKDDLLYGDRMLIDYTPGKGTRVSINGTKLMTTGREKFFNLLLSTWVGRRPPSSEFKSDILSMSDSDESRDLISRQQVVLPETGRAKQVAAWAPAKNVKQSKKTDKTKAKPTKKKQPVAVAKQTPKTKPEKKTTTPPTKTKTKIAAPSILAPTIPPVAVAPPVPKPPVSKSIPAKKKIAKTEPAKKKPSKKAELVAKQTKPAVKKAAPKPKAKPTTTAAASTKPSPVKTDSKEKQTTTKSKTNQPVKVAEPDKKPAAPVKKAEDKPTTDKNQARLTGLQNIYRANMLRMTYRHVVYPSRALNLNQEGTVILKVTVNRKGKVLDIEHDKRSQYVSLNKAASKAVKKANPFPKIPDELEGKKFEFKIPIKFRIPR